MSEWLQVHLLFKYCELNRGNALLLNGTPEAIYHSLTKHLFAYVETRVSLCQFPSHGVLLRQMCRNSSGSCHPAPLPLLPARPPSCSPSVAKDLTGGSSSEFSIFCCCHPPPVPSLISLPPLYFSISPFLVLFSFLPPSMSTNYGGVRKGQYKDLVWPTH